MHESFPPMYGDQVIPWTQRKCQAENLSGGGLRVVGQGESSSDQQGKQASEPRPSIPMFIPIITPAKSRCSVRYILSSGNPSPTLKLASSEATNQVRSRQLGILWDDQALLATGSVRFEGAFAVPRCLPPALFHPLTSSLPPPPIRSSSPLLSLSHAFRPKTRQFRHVSRTG